MKRLAIYTILSCHLFLASCSKNDYLPPAAPGAPWQPSPEGQRIYAGRDQLIELPAKEIRLSGEVPTFFSSRLTKVTWRKVTGPDGVVIQSPDSESTLLTNLSDGHYEFEFSAVHPDLKFRSDTVTIIAGSLGNNAEEILLTKQKWEAPCYAAFIRINDLYKRNPRLVPGRFYKLLIRRENSTEWEPVVPYTENTGKYFFEFCKDQSSTYILYWGNDYADSPDVKIVF